MMVQFWSDRAIGAKRESLDLFLLLLETAPSSPITTIILEPSLLSPAGSIAVAGGSILMINPCIPRGQQMSTFYKFLACLFSHPA
jgi:hypothetical protein